MKLIENSAVTGHQSTTTKKKKKNTERVGRWEWLIRAGVLLRACRIEREKFISKYSVQRRLLGQAYVHLAGWTSLTTERLEFIFIFILFSSSNQQSQNLSTQFSIMRTINNRYVTKLIFSRATCAKTVPKYYSCVRAFVSP